LNVEGMKRRGTGRDAMNELKESYRLLFRSEEIRSTVVEQLRGSLKTAEGKELLAFFQRPTERGIVTRPQYARRRTPNGQTGVAIENLDES